ncbi:hypothetical protein ACWA7J_13435 [Leptothrix sp. BB-4]
MPSSPDIFQICLVVPDAHLASAHWSRVLGRPEAPVETLFAGGIVHQTHGRPTTPTCRSPSTTSVTSCWS